MPGLVKPEILRFEEKFLCARKPDRVVGLLNHRSGAYNLLQPMELIC